MEENESALDSTSNEPSIVSETCENIIGGEEELALASCDINEVHDNSTKECDSKEENLIKEQATDSPADRECITVTNCELPYNSVNSLDSTQTTIPEDDFFQDVEAISEVSSQEVNQSLAGEGDNSSQNIDNSEDTQEDVGRSPIRDEDSSENVLPLTDAANTEEVVEKDSNDSVGGENAAEESTNQSDNIEKEVVVEEATDNIDNVVAEKSFEESTHDTDNIEKEVVVEETIILRDNAEDEGVVEELKNCADKNNISSENDECADFLRESCNDQAKKTKLSNDGDDSLAPECAEKIADSASSSSILDSVRTESCLILDSSRECETPEVSSRTEQALDESNELCDNEGVSSEINDPATMSENTRHLLTGDTGSLDCVGNNNADNSSKELASEISETDTDLNINSNADNSTKQIRVVDCQTATDTQKDGDVDEVPEPAPAPQLVLLSSSLMSSKVVNSQSVSEEDVCIIPHDIIDLTEETDAPTASKASDVISIVTSKTQMCTQCKQIKLCGLKLRSYTLCSEACHQQLISQTAQTLANRTCRQCQTHLSATRFIWQAMDFCSDICIAHFQMFIGARCAHCSLVVPSASFGKYCVRFGCDIKQFCGKTCLEHMKKAIPLCAFCDNRIPVSSSFKTATRDFCSNSCLKNYEIVTRRGKSRTGPCAVCSKVKLVNIEFQQGSILHSLCSEPCFAAFKFVNDITEVQCEQCQKFFDKTLSDKIMIVMDEWPLQFCTKSCLNIFVMESRRIAFCACCKVKKYNFDMIVKATRSGPIVSCSLLCLRSYSTCAKCDGICNPQCLANLTDGSTKYFCSEICGKTYDGATIGIEQVPGRSQEMGVQAAPQSRTNDLQVYQHIITKTMDRPEVKNKSILCKPFMHNKGTACRPMPCHKDSQTDDGLNPPKIIPVPVPIYVPAPMVMYSTIFPVPIPVPFPIPVPLFIPTTRNSTKGILKEIKKIHEKMPADPFEAELLMMAEMVAGDKKQDVTDSESDREDQVVVNDVTDSYSPEPVDTNNSFGDDIMQMALFASDLAEPQVDMESVLTSNTITPSQHPTDDNKSLYGGVPEESPHTLSMRNRKRPVRGGRGGATPQQNKRGRRSTTPNDVNMHHNMHHNMGMAHMVQPEPQRLEVEKPDAHLQLKYTFGVNAWRHWVMQKNQELEKAMLSNRKIKPFKPDLLQLTADELNFSLCLFVKEVKKPNGQEYAPDTIYYLCLGIQQYLFENGRIDNIFTDTYYEKFTDCLDEVAKKFAALYNDSQFIVTRVEEEHLWESRQLGAHSPHVLLSTLMFFNTKHFNLVTVEEHMQLSFSHIMKHWKRNPNAPGVTKVPGSRNVLLRFYPPQAALEANSRKKKVYEQQENEVDPLRCPVKLYEFYLSKCPESVKTRNDVFYLLPERSCVPDSPVWYSTMALGKEPLMKMLHRVKMVKEINVALLNS